MDFSDLNEKLPPATNKLPESPSCGTAAFALANPGLCPNESRLVLKPEQVTRCGRGGVIKFEAFTSAYNTETRLTAGLTFESSDTNVVTVNAGGVATIVGPGVATVSVTSGSDFAHARVTIMADDNCCENISVVTALAVDNSKSMNQAFGEDWPTKLYVAKELARRYASAVDTDKDKVAVMAFNEGGVTVWISPSDSAALLAEAINAIGGTERLTDVRLAILEALALLQTSDLDRKVLIVFSDGEQRPLMGLQEYEDFQSKVRAFKEGGGIVITCGIRAKADGYVLLRNLGSSGFFLNIRGDDSMQASVDYLLGTMGYFCAAAPLAGGYGYGYVHVAQVPDTSPLTECELYEPSAG